MKKTSQLTSSSASQGTPAPTLQQEPARNISETIEKTSQLASSSASHATPEPTLQEPATISSETIEKTSQVASSLPAELHQSLHYNKNQQ